MSRPIDPQRPRAILAAARSVFRERGYANARMADIAHVAGVAPGTLYLYYASKEALVTTLAEEYVARINARVEAAISEPDLRIAIERGVHDTLALAKEESDIIRLLDLNSGLSERTEPLPSDAKLYEILARNLVERMERGEVRVYQPDALAKLICGMIEWVCRACVSWGWGDVAEYEATVVRVLQEALLPTRPAAA